MSWQGNECFIETIEYKWDRDDRNVNESLIALLNLYDENGRGWYLLGYMDPRGDEDDYDEFELRRYPLHGLKFGSGLLPNPFMNPLVDAFKVRAASDLIAIAFECWDSRCDTVAYAGDGDEPLERVEVYGKTYDMRAR